MAAVQLLVISDIGFKECMDDTMYIYMCFNSLKLTDP